MRQKTLAMLTCAAIALAVSPATAADHPLNPAYVDAEATFVFHIDVERALHSRIVSSIIDHHKLEEELEGDLAEMRDTLGLDPFKDIKSITAYGNDLDAGPSAVVVVTTDAVDQAIERLKQEAPDEIHMVDVDGYEVYLAGDATGHIRNQGGHERLVVIAERQSELIKALHVIDGKRPSQFGTELPEFVKQPKAGAFIWAYATDLGSLNIHERASIIAGHASAMFMQAGESNDRVFLNVSMNTASEEDARKVAQVAQGLIALGILIAESEKDADPELKQLSSLLSGVSVRSSGSSLSVEVSVHIDDLPLDEFDLDFD